MIIDCWTTDLLLAGGIFSADLNLKMTYDDDM